MAASAEPQVPLLQELLLSHELPIFFLLKDEIIAVYYIKKLFSFLNAHDKPDNACAAWGG
jgi:hypothetical protein